MKASELRIGNLVSNMNPRHNDSILTIESIGDNHEVNMFYRKYLLSELEPIPLTEEWLLKFGFVKHKTTDIYPTFAKQMFNWNDGILYIIGYGFMNHIKHVHQLQNIYFALTGEELVVKE